MKTECKLAATLIDTGYSIGKSGKRYLRYKDSMSKDLALLSYSNGNRSYYKHYPKKDYPYKHEYNVLACKVCGVKHNV